MEKFLAKKLQIERWKVNRSQQDIAACAFLSVSGYAQIERGQRNPKADTLFAIAKALDKPMEYFFE